LEERYRNVKTDTAEPVVELHPVDRIFWETLLEVRANVVPTEEVTATRFPKESGIERLLFVWREAERAETSDRVGVAPYGDDDIITIDEQITSGLKTLVDAVKQTGEDECLEFEREPIPHTGELL
jgi:hypothetical protein